VRAPRAPIRDLAGPAGPEASPDHELVAAVRLGDDEAFASLFGRYRRWISGYAFRMTGDHGRAEDLTQEVFLSALRRMRETQRPIAFKPWIFEIARNACIDHHRRISRREEVPLEGEGAAAASGAGRRPASRSSAAAVEARQQLSDLCGALGGLTEMHHRILVLREFEGRSYQEIGERLGLSRTSVESTLFRARRRLSAEYDEIASGRRCLRVQAILREGRAAGLGARDARRLERHLSHCQACRRPAPVARTPAGSLPAVAALPAD
jgi:RNA polymerase sigma factor (sigma-70 family)